MRWQETPVEPLPAHFQTLEDPQAKYLLAFIRKDLQRAASDSDSTPQAPQPTRQDQLKATRRVQDKIFERTAYTTILNNVHEFCLAQFLPQTRGVAGVGARDAARSPREARADSASVLRFCACTSIDGFPDCVLRLLA